MKSNLEISFKIKCIFVQVDVKQALKVSIQKQSFNMNCFQKHHKDFLFEFRSGGRRTFFKNIHQKAISNDDEVNHTTRSAIVHDIDRVI